jgi:hypothetical protein
MAKKKHPAPRPAASDKPATLKDLINPDIVNKLRAQSDQMRADEEAKKEQARKLALEAQKAEQKRLDNDFEHLLNNSSPDWRKFKK